MRRLKNQKVLHSDPKERQKNVHLSRKKNSPKIQITGICILKNTKNPTSLTSKSPTSSLKDFYFKFFAACERAPQILKSA